MVIIDEEDDLMKKGLRHSMLSPFIIPVSFRVDGGVEVVSRHQL